MASTSFVRVIKIALALLLLTASPARAQMEASTWYFGDRVGFDFRQGSPTPALEGQLTTLYACAVACDPATGEALFYTNGEQVWNRAHRLMPNGRVRGFSNATQGALIVPVPGEAQRYFVFTLFQQVQRGGAINDGGACQLFSSVVDLRLAGGLGDVEAAGKNTPLGGHLTEKLTAVRHANGRDYWVLAHAWGSNEFLVYAVTAQGVAGPVRQAIGASHPAVLADTALFHGLKGHLQASPNGRQVASAVFDVQPFGLFDFDAATGTLSNYVNLGTLRDAYGVGFSPDNTKLYVQNFSRVPAERGGGFNIVSQYDVAAGSAGAVAASGQSIVMGNSATNIDQISSEGTFYNLQNSPDGRMYGASWYRGTDTPPGDTGLQTFYVIGRPNARGYDCDIRHQRFEFAQRTAGPGLPNFMQHYFDGLEPRPAEAECAPNGAEVFPNPTTDAFRVRLPGPCPLPFALTLYDALGRRVLTRAVSDPNAETPINVAALAPGVYTVVLRFAQRTVVRKLVKW